MCRRRAHRQRPKIDDQRLEETKNSPCQPGEANQPGWVPVEMQRANSSRAKYDNQAILRSIWSLPWQDVAAGGKGKGKKKKKKEQGPLDERRMGDQPGRQAETLSGSTTPPSPHSSGRLVRVAYPPTRRWGGATWEFLLHPSPPLGRAPGSRLQAARSPASHLHASLDPACQRPSPPDSLKRGGKKRERRVSGAHRAGADLSALSCPMARKSAALQLG